MQPRRSTRQSAPPDQLGFPVDNPLHPDDPLPTIETIKQEDAMADQPAFNTTQQAFMINAIAEAVRAALVANATPSSNDQRQQRSLTADL